MYEFPKPKIPIVFAAKCRQNRPQGNAQMAEKAEILGQ
jgi:hypothetical protein